MYILKNRPLATILIVLLGGFAFFGIATLLWRVIFLTLLLSSLVLVACFARGKAHTRFILTLLLCCAISALLSFVYFDLWFFADRRFASEEETEIRGQIIEVYHTDGYTTIADIKLEAVNDTPLSSYVMRIHDETGELGRVEPGDTICAKVQLSSIRDSDADSTLSLIGQGISAIATVLERTDHPPSASYTLHHILFVLRTKFTERAVQYSNEDVGGLLTALITGNKDLLEPTLRLSFSRIGISHILALSGMHLSILSMAVIGLLSLLGLGKKTRTVLLFPLILLYTLFAGAPSSLLRAATMLLLSCALFLLRQSRDSITSLVVTVFGICAFSPHAIFDIGLWLSALATLGLLLVLEGSERIQAPFFRRCLFKIGFAFVLTFGALSASLLLSITVFEGLSLIGPVATFVFGYLIQIYIYLGLLTVTLGSLLPLGRVLIPLYDSITALAEHMASGRYTYVDATYDAVRVLAVIFTVGLLLFVLLPVRRKRTVLLSLTALFISVYATALGMSIFTRNRTTVSYAASDTQEMFILSSEGYSAVIDIGRGGRDFGERTLFYLYDEHIRYLDAYILTRYSVYLPQTVEVILSSVYCQQLYIPYPQNEKEVDVYERLVRMSATYGVTLVPYSSRTPLDIGGLRFETLVRTVEDTTVSLWMYIAKDEYIFTYFSRGSITKKTEAAATEIIARSDAVMFGSCGHSTDYILDIPLSNKVKQCIIADEGLRIRKDMYEAYQRRTRVVLHPMEYTIIH